MGLVAAIIGCEVSQKYRVLKKFADFFVFQNQHFCFSDLL